MSTSFVPSWCADLDTKMMSWLDTENKYRQDSYALEEGETEEKPTMKESDICVNLSSIFVNMKQIGGGGAAAVYSAQIAKIPRDLQLPPVGTRVAIRQGYIGESNRHLKTLCKLAPLKDKHISENFPIAYDYFVCLDWPRNFIKEGRKDPYLCIVMEQLDGTLENIDFSSTENPTIAWDAFAFEFLYAEMAFYYEANVIVQDVKWRNLGLKRVPYWRLYQINDDMYLFPPGYMYKRIDLDGRFKEIWDLWPDKWLLNTKYPQYPWASENVTPTLAFFNKTVKDASPKQLQTDDVLNLIREAWKNYKFYGEVKELATSKHNNLKHFTLTISAITPSTIPLAPPLAEEEYKLAPGFAYRVVRPSPAYRPLVSKEMLRTIPCEGLNILYNERDWIEFLKYYFPLGSTPQKLDKSKLCELAKKKFFFPAVH